MLVAGIVCKCTACRACEVIGWCADTELVVEVAEGWKMAAWTGGAGGGKGLMGSIGGILENSEQPCGKNISGYKMSTQLEY